MLRREDGVVANGARELNSEFFLVKALKVNEAALEFMVVAKEFLAKASRFGVHAVASAHGEHELGFKSACFERFT